MKDQQNQPDPTVSGGINEALDGVESLVSPQRGARLVWKVVVIVMCVMLGAAAVRFASKVLGRTETVTAPAVDTTVITRSWFTQKFEEIQSLATQITTSQQAIDAEIAAAQQALERKQKESESRWVSRDGDRAEFDRLNHQIMSLQAKRASITMELQNRRAALIVEYNTCAREHSSFDIAPIGTAQ